MHLNILRNHKSVYYNCLTNFYLLLNTVLPYYDDIIVTLQKQALISLKVEETDLKKQRLLQFVADVSQNINKYRVVIDDDFNTLHFVEIESDDSDSDLDEDYQNKIADTSESTDTDEEDKKTL